MFSFEGLFVQYLFVSSLTLFACGLTSNLFDVVTGLYRVEEKIARMCRIRPEKHETTGITSSSKRDHSAQCLVKRNYQMGVPVIMTYPDTSVFCSRREHLVSDTG